MFFGVYSVDVDGIGLPALPQAEAELSVWCDQRPCLAGHKKKTAAAPIHPDLPTCRAKADDWGLRLRNQDYLDVLYASQVAL